MAGDDGRPRREPWQSRQASPHAAPGLRSHSFCFRAWYGNVTDSIVENLRKAIEAKHQEALRALETLRCYLKHPVVSEHPQLRDQGKESQEADRATIRERVLEQIRDQARSVREIEANTGLTKRQVRGVISAPDLKNRIERTVRHGVTHYRYVADGNSTDEDAAATLGS